MAGVPSSVGVGEPTVITKRIDNTRVTTSEGDVERQVIGVADPEDADARARVLSAPPAADAPGLVVRLAGDVTVAGQAPLNYDSGLQAVPDSDAQVTDVDTDVHVLMVMNTTTQQRHLSLRDDIGGVYMDEQVFAPKSTTAVMFEGVTFASGIRWQVRTGQTGLNAQIKGRQ